MEHDQPGSRSPTNLQWVKRGWGWGLGEPAAMSEDGLYDFLEKNFGRTVDRAACSAVAEGSVPSPPHPRTLRA